MYTIMVLRVVVIVIIAILVLSSIPLLPTDSINQIQYGFECIDRPLSQSKVSQSEK